MTFVCVRAHVSMLAVEKQLQSAVIVRDSHQFLFISTGIDIISAVNQCNTISDTQITNALQRKQNVLLELTCTGNAS